MAGRPVYGAHRLQFDLPTPITVDLTRRETSRLAGSRAVFYGESVSVFSAAEIAYLERMTMGRLATVGADGRPHVVPMTFHFNAAEDTVDLGGVDLAASKKWRDMQINPKATFLVSFARRRARDRDQGRRGDPRDRRGEH